MKGRLKYGIAAAAVYAACTGLFHLLNVLDGVRAVNDPLNLRLYCLLLAAALAGAVLFGRAFLLKGTALPRLFFASGLFLGLLYMCVMPGLSAPDEMSHYISAYRISNVMTGQPALTEAGLVGVRPGDYILEDLSGVKTPEIPDDEEPKAEILGNPVTFHTYRQVLSWDRMYPAGDASGALVSSGLADVRTTPVMYLPQAAGMSAARLLGLNAPGLIFLGRLMNLLVFLLLSAAAIRTAPFGKELFFGSALLPMSLHLAASLSYDAGIIGTSFLFTACILRLAYEKERVTAWDGLLLCALAAVLGPCKMIYSALILLIFLIPEKRFARGRAGKALLFIAVLISLSAAMYAVNAATIASYAGADAGAVTVRAEQAAGYSVSELIRRPVFILRMLGATFAAQSDELLCGMTGMWLGNLDPLLGIPYYAVLLLTLALFVMALSVPGEELKMSPAARLFTAAVCVLVVLLASGAMLVSWTSRDSSVIQGLQGRYFLPVLPAALLIIRNELVVLRSDCRRYILYFMLVLDLGTLLRLFALACLRI